MYVLRREAVRTVVKMNIEKKREKVKQKRKGLIEFRII